MNIWQDKINRITKDYLDELVDCPQPMLAIAPFGKWSIAQHVQHVIRLNESYFEVFDSIITDRHKPPALAWCKPWVNFCGNLVYKAVQPANKKRTRTFKVWEPDDTIYTDGLWDLFQAHQAKLIEYFSDLASKTNKSIVIASPANPKIIYYLDKALLIMLAHELRHLNQALVLKKQLSAR